MTLFSVFILSWTAFSLLVSSAVCQIYCNTAQVQQDLVVIYDMSAAATATAATARHHQHTAISTCLSSTNGGTYHCLIVWTASNRQVGTDTHRKSNFERRKININIPAERNPSFTMGKGKHHAGAILFIAPWSLRHWHHITLVSRWYVVPVLDASP